MITVLIPAYRPDEKLIGLLQQIKEKGYDILVVDDGSGPQFKDIFRRAEDYGKVISYEENKGKGHALKIGFSYLKDRIRRNDIVVTADADGQHTITDITNVSDCVNGDRCMVLGCRTFEGKIPLRSRIGNILVRGLFALVTGRKVSDTQTGLRAFSEDLLEELCSINGNRYEYEMNMLLDFSGRNTSIVEVPIETIYEKGNPSSHFNPLKDSFIIMFQIIKYAMSSFASFLVDYTLFTLFTVLGLGTALSNVTARIISGSVNFLLNRKLVFGSQKDIKKSFFQYALLAASVLILNTYILYILTSLIGMNVYLAKILTETFMFFVTYSVQKNHIFAEDR